MSRNVAEDKKDESLQGFGSLWWIIGLGFSSAYSSTLVDFYNSTGKKTASVVEKA